MTGLAMLGALDKIRTAVSSATGSSATGHFERGVEAYERKRYLRALDSWRQAHALGDAEAAHRIGQLYARGEGVMYSLPDAVIWYRQAADAGHA